MSTVIGNLRVVLGLDSTAFQQGMQSATAGLRQMGERMQQVGKSLSMRITAPMVAAGAAASAAFVGSSRNLAELKRQADIAGMAVQDFKIAALAVEEFGVTQEKLSDILKDVNDKFGDFAATGAGPLADFFENIAPKVGLTLKSFDGLSSSDALALYVTSLEKANVSQAEMTFYMEALANDATALIPAFRDGGAAIAAMAVRAKDLGLALDEDLIASAQQTQKDFRVVAEVLKTQFQQAVVGLAPAFSELLKSIAPLMESLSGIVASLASLTARLSQVSPDTLKWGVALAAAAAALGPVLVGLGLFLAGIGPILAGIGSIAGAFSGLAVAAAAISAPVAAFVAAVGGAAYLAWDNWEVVGPWFMDLFTSIGDVFVGLSETIAGVVTGDLSRSVEGLKQAWGGLQDFFRTLWAGVVAAFEMAVDKIKPLIEWFEGAVDRIDRGFSRITGAGRGGGPSSGWSGGDSGADVMAPPVPEIQSGLAQGTADIAAQGERDAEGYADRFRKGMGIQSPSRVMIEVGEHLSRGLSIGIERQQAPVISAMQNIGDGLIGVLENTALRGGSLIDGLRQMGASLAGTWSSNIFRGAIGGLFGSIGVPGFATGVSHFRGGMATIHERGGELAIMPSGSTVIPHDLSKRMMDQDRGYDRMQVLVEAVPNPYFDTRVSQISGAGDMRTLQAAQRAMPGQMRDMHARGIR